MGSKLMVVRVQRIFRCVYERMNAIFLTYKTSPCNKRHTNKVLSFTMDSGGLKRLPDVDVHFVKVH